MAKHWADVADGARRRVAGSRWGQPRLLFEMALGMTLVAGGAVGVVVWQRQVTDPRTVVVAAHDLARGDTLSADDLRTATLMGVDGVRLMPVADAAELIGTTLSVDVPAATPLSLDLVERRPLPLDGEALLSVALRPGEVPPDLAVSDRVRMLTVRLDPLGTAPPVVAIDPGEVWAVRLPTEVDPTTVVTLRAPVAALERIALADRVRLGVLAR